MDTYMEEKGVAEGLSFSRYVMASALSRAFADPMHATALPGDPVWHDPQMFAEAWAILVEGAPPGVPAKLGFGEIAPAEVGSGALYAFLHLEGTRREAVYRAVFGMLGAKECSPYETEYLPWNDATYRAQQLADVAGFQQAFGLVPSTKRRERHDHISLELELIAFLHLKVMVLHTEAAAADGEGAEPLAVCRDALAHFVRDHLAWWVPGFGQLVDRTVDERLATADLDDPLSGDLKLFAEVARLLRGWVVTERRANGVDASHRAIDRPEVAVPPPEADGGCGATCPSS